ncbi:VaFE repeat-containing surface-anchored protein [Actinomyces faecalis]|uniref:VaFE repeat-containing surface-anchored protein n=1 Tax=Actinomyces faecalis TaxID=2722820 RepID=UPI001556A538|nr:VaFE repeat-containing surface-anchored protein [Actinomyces faecalis]
MVKTTTPGVPTAHRSRLGSSLAANPRRAMLRRCAAIAMTGTLALSGLAGAVASDAFIPQAHAVDASETSGYRGVNVGRGYELRYTLGGTNTHWLGANRGPDGGLAWCIDWSALAPTPDQLLNPAELAAQDQRGDTPSELSLNPAQTYTVFSQYESVNEENSRAALSILAHANYDRGSYVPGMLAAIQQAFPDAYATAVSYASWGKQNTPQNYEIPSASAPTQVRTGTINNIIVTADDGSVITGIPVKVVLRGPAVFDATGTDTWTGTSASTATSLAWTATGNGEVAFDTYYQLPGGKMVRYDGAGNVQDEIGVSGPYDPQQVTKPGQPFRVFYDFQPVATSSVVDAGSKVVDHAATSLSDTIRVRADESYSESPEWMYDGAGNLVPVVLRGTAYYVGQRPAEVPGEVPAGAQVVGSTTVTATGPGTYTATITTDAPVDSQFVTWVWEVVKADQGDYSSYVAGDWSDSWGLADETTSVRERVEVDSTIQSNVTKSGTYLVDSLYVDGFDADHTDFEGGAGFAADVDEMTQSLYFFPADLPVVDANKDKARLIGEVTVPARNGYVDRVGSGKFKMLEGSPAGTYVFVTSFAGDDRTEPYASSVTDKYEQVRVEPTPPEIRTTATDKADGDKLLASTGDVTIQDKVCQAPGKSLKVGQTYTLTATAMDKATGQAVLDDNGKPYTGSAEFTPASEDDCGLVDVTIPAKKLNGKRVVMFEAVALDGTTVALHTDINDEGQTVEGGEEPEVGTTLTDRADGDHEVAPGPVTLEDKVCPRNDTTFVAGRTYTVTGRLMDKATGKPVVGKDGKEVTASSDFTPATSTDCATVTFAFDTSDLAGRDVVAFEKVFEQGLDTEIASHEDINDEGQTVRVSEPGKPGRLARTGAAATLAGVSAAGLVGSGVVLVRRRRNTVAGSEMADVELV